MDKKPARQSPLDSQQTTPAKPDEFPEPSTLQTPVQVIQSYGNIATTRQLLAAGFTGYDLTKTVRLGLAFRIRRGWYAIPGQVTDAQYAAVRVGGMLAGLSAAASYGIWGHMAAKIEVSVAENAARLRTNRKLGDKDASIIPLTPDHKPDEISLHWDPLSRITRWEDRDLWRVSLEQCLIQVLRWSTKEDAVACIDVALQKRLITRSRLKKLLEKQSSRAWLRVFSSRIGSDSGLESIARQRVSHKGLSFQQQVQICEIGRVDMLFAADASSLSDIIHRISRRNSVTQDFSQPLIGSGGLVVEYDGAEFHGSWDAAERDRERDALLSASGFRVLRFTFRQVMQHWDFVERTIRAVIMQL